MYSFEKVFIGNKINEAKRIKFIFFLLGELIKLKFHLQNSNKKNKAMSYNDFMKYLKSTFFLCLFFFHTTTFGTITIGFGSCNQQGKDIGQYEQMFLANLDAWLWLGDNIYADFFPPLERRKAYNKIKNNFYYRALSEQTTILGTWDDHDYAYNNAGSSYRKKEQSKQEFLRFINFPENDEIRSRPGIYYDRIIKKNNLRVHLIFLDMRSFSSRKVLLEKSNGDGLKT